LALVGNTKLGVDAAEKATADTIKTTISIAPRKHAHLLMTVVELFVLVFIKTSIEELVKINYNLALRMHTLLITEVTQYDDLRNFSQ